jgi:hypothetical protein
MSSNLSNVLILPLNSPEPDSSMYVPLRQTRRFKYYSTIVNPTAMDVVQIREAPEDLLDAFENAFSQMNITNGGRRISRRNKRSKRSKRRRSRKH